jgi:hypothetical protein
LSKTERSKQINPELEQMQRELDRLRTENNELRRRLGISVAETPVDYHVRLKEPTLHDPQLPLLTAESSTPEKITYSDTSLKEEKTSMPSSGRMNEAARRDILRR